MARLPTWLTGAVLLATCSPAADAGVFTLYRSSPPFGGGDSGRIHVATFDATDGERYNRENCEMAARLFGSQPGVMVRYWCEPGWYRRGS